MMLLRQTVYIAENGFHFHPSSRFKIHQHTGFIRREVAGEFHIPVHQRFREFRSFRRGDKAYLLHQCAGQRFDSAPVGHPAGIESAAKHGNRIIRQVPKQFIPAEPCDIFHE